MQSQKRQNDLFLSKAKHSISWLLLLLLLNCFSRVQLCATPQTAAHQATPSLGFSRQGCHFLLQCMKVKSESEVAQSCPTLRNPMNCSLPGSSAHGIFQSKVLEWGAIAFSEYYGNPSLFPEQQCWRSWRWTVLWRYTRSLRTNTPKICHFHYRRLEYKNTKSRNTWSNRQIWPWRTEWRRAKANRVLPREHIGHSKHPLPTTQGKTLHMDITR